MMTRLGYEDDHYTYYDDQIRGWVFIVQILYLWCVYIEYEFGTFAL